MSAIGDRYERRSRAFAAKIAATPTDRWTSPSPCEHWLARDVVAHIVEMHEIVLGRATDRNGSTSLAPSDFDPLTAFDGVRTRAAAVLADPTTPTELARAIDDELGIDLPQHGWDLAKATGQDPTIDAVDVAELWAAVSLFTPSQWSFMRTPGSFGPGIVVYGPEVAVPASAPLQDRLLGLLGRDPRWTPAGLGELD
jgi:uncharacterized protein (TIGR03086 family)